MRRYFDGTAWTQHREQMPARLSSEDRADRLDLFLAQHIQRYPFVRVESRTAHHAVIVSGSPPNHVVHALITIFTCGLWVFVWIWLSGTQKEQRVSFHVDPYGNVVQSG
jgi:hypothetical protein